MKLREKIQNEYAKELMEMVDGDNPAAICLVKEAAFLAGWLHELRDTINAQGVVEEYDHRGMTGRKQSAEVNTYVSFHKSFSANIKQLIAIAPEKKDKNALQAFMAKHG